MTTETIQVIRTYELGGDTDYVVVKVVPLLQQVKKTTQYVASLGYEVRNIVTEYGDVRVDGYRELGKPMGKKKIKMEEEGGVLTIYTTDKKILVSDTGIIISQQISGK